MTEPPNGERSRPAPHGPARNVAAAAKRTTDSRDCARRDRLALSILRHRAPCTRGDLDLVDLALAGADLELLAELDRR